MDTRGAFGDWLKHQRKAYGYTQQELAQRVGCSTATISRIEEGLLRPSRQLAELVFAGLEIAPQERPALVQWARRERLKAAGAAGQGGLGSSPALAARALVVDSAPPVPASINPYKGLRAFTEADAPDFFGREALAAHLCTRLLDGPEPPRALRFLAVVGPSGCGKSSLIRAGLLPAVRAAGLPGGLRPIVADLVPGAYPFEELEAALLRVAVNPPTSLLEQLQTDARGLIRAAKRVLPPAGAGLLLLIDQFEEVFTLVRDEPARALLLDGLLAAAGEPGLPFWAVITLRADFYDRPLLYSAGYALLRECTETAGVLAPDELHRAIVAPAARGGVTLEPELVATLEQEAAAQPGALPLLEYTLTELFASRAGAGLTLAAYRTLGGLQGALGRRAEELYTGLDGAAQAEARQLFLRLVTLGEGTEDTRRRVLRAELASAAGDEEAFDRVLDGFGAARLLTFDRDPRSRGPVVEVAHEALWRAWGRLRGWLDDSRAARHVQRQLLAAAGEWAQAGRDGSYLATGARLAQFAALAGAAGQAGVRLSAEEREYLRASLGEQDRQAVAERQRQDHEMELAWQAAAGFAHSEALRLAAEANALLLEEQNPETIALLALRSMHIEYTPQGDAALTGAMRLAYPIRVLAGHTDHRLLCGISSSGAVASFWLGKYLLTGSQDRSARLWDVRAGKEIRHFAHPDGVCAVALSPGDRYALTGSFDRIVRLWDVESGQEIHQFAGHTERVTAVSFSQDGRYALSASTDGTARVWERDTGKELYRLQIASAPVDSATAFFFLDDRGIRTTSRSQGEVTVRTWDVASGQMLMELPRCTDCWWPPDLTLRHLLATTGGGAEVWDIIGGNRIASLPASQGLADLSIDGKTVLTGDANGVVTLWDVLTGARVRQFVGLRSTVASLALSPDGRMVAAGDSSGTALLWDAQTGALLKHYAGHTKLVTAVYFTPDGLHLLTESGDFSYRLWATCALDGLPWFGGHGGTVETATFSADGKLILTASRDGTARLWDARTGAALRTLGGPASLLYRAALSPDGRLALSTGADNSARLWDVATGQELHRFHLPDEGISAGISPDGRYGIVGVVEHAAHVYDLQNYRQLLTLSLGSAALDSMHGSAVAVAFSPDGKHVLTGNADFVARLWDAGTGQEVQQFQGHENVVFGTAFSPDGRWVLTGSFDKTARLWDSQTAQEVRRFAGHTAEVNHAAFSHDGRYVVTASNDRTARIWHVETGREFRRLIGHTDGVVWAEFSPDDRMVLTSSNDGTARLWYVDYQEEERYLCAKLLRDFTPGEREQFEIRDDRPTCPPI